MKLSELEALRRKRRGSGAAAAVADLEHRLYVIEQHLGLAPPYGTIPDYEQRKVKHG